MRSEPLAPGTSVAGKYVVERVLGHGGMGIVYVVAHATTGKRMAMKCLLPALLYDGGLVARFMREAQVMGRLSHRHVVDVFDVGRDGDILFIVMELLEGKPLSELVQDEALTLEEALAILLRAMEGVVAAHEQGVVHRDLKPDNIFVCLGASGRLDDPRVLDFGISKLEDGENQQLTRSGVAMGTPNYMAIEQLNGQRDLDQRVDVYAMGVILYEAVAGQLPYQADSVSALAIRMLTTEPTHLAALSPDLPSGLADVVMKAMARQRDDRYRSMRQLIVALRPYVPQGAGVLVPEGRGRPLRTPRTGGRVRGRDGSQPAPARALSAVGTAQRSGALRWVRWLALAGVLLAGALVAALLVRRAREDPPAAASAPPAVPSTIGTSTDSKVSPSPSATLTPDASVSAGGLSQMAVDAGRPIASAPVDAGRPKPWARPVAAPKPRPELAPSPRKSASEAAVEVVPAPTPAPPDPPRKSAAGRAGHIDSDEF